MDLKVCIATHKKFDPPKEDYFLPIQVGKAINEDLGYQGDDTLESISAKNPNYCELTALYWAWKNLDYDVLGLCHYRRYFDIENKTNRINDIRFISEQEFEASNFPQKKILSYLNKHDVILAKPRIIEFSVEVAYGMAHMQEDYKILTDVISELYPEYNQSWNKISNLTNKIISYNMFIAPKHIIDPYCEWLFSILTEVEKRIKLSPYPYQQRVIGFLAERLMTMYFVHHNFKIKYLPVLFVKDENFKYSTPSKLSKMLSNSYKNFLFFLSSLPRRFKS